jgi:hypothetical protein
VALLHAGGPTISKSLRDEGSHGQAHSVQIPTEPSREFLVTGGSVRCILPGLLADQLNAKCKTWIADSIGDAGRRAELVVTWLGTRSEPANLAANRRGHKRPQKWCCTRPHPPVPPAGPVTAKATSKAPE